jgi:hypothetical protein
VAANQVFAVMKKNGWHEVQWVDGTGAPINDDNLPRDAFEKGAIKKILAGDTYVEEVIDGKDGKYLRAATLVPAVNEKCLICHPNSKVGDVLGALSYKLKIE